MDVCKTRSGALAVIFGVDICHRRSERDAETRDRRSSTKFSGHKKYGVATSSVTEGAEESKEKVNEYAYPIASGVCDAAWMFAFDALEDDLLEHERSDDAMMNFADGAVSFVLNT